MTPIKLVPVARCRECGMEWPTWDAYADAVCREAFSGAHAVGLMEDDYCPACGEREAVEEVE